MALVKSCLAGAGGSYTVTESEREGTSFTIDLTGVKFVVLGYLASSTTYPYVYNVATGTWSRTPTGFTPTISGNTMSVTAQTTYNHYVTIK